MSVCEPYFKLEPLSMCDTFGKNINCTIEVPTSQKLRYLKVDSSNVNTLQHQVVVKFSEDGSLNNTWRRFKYAPELQQTKQCEANSFACNRWVCLMDKTVSTVTHWCFQCYRDYIATGNMIKLQQQYASLYCFHIHEHSLHHYHCWHCGRTTEQEQCDVKEINCLNNVQYIWKSMCRQCKETENNRDCISGEDTR